MTDDRLFNEPIAHYADLRKEAYFTGLIDALEIIDNMVDGNQAIQAWNFMAKRSADVIRKMIKEG